MNSRRLLSVALLSAVSLVFAACGEDNDDTPPQVLNQSIGTTETEIPLANAAALPGRGTVRIDSEQLSYTGKNGNTLTGVTRGVNGTRADAHAAGAVVVLVSEQVPATPTEPPPPTATEPPPPTSTNTTRPTDTPVVVVPTDTPGGDTPTTGPTDTPAPDTPTPTPTPTEPEGADICGDGEQTGTEECDDGNLFGGDGCAANCTNERRAMCVLGGSSGAQVQTTLFAIPLSLTGAQFITGGNPRNEVVETTEPGLSFNPGDIPMVITPEDIQIEPVVVPGLVCACVRGVPFDAFGGMAGDGKAGCGSGGFAGPFRTADGIRPPEEVGIDVLFSIDHDVPCDDPGAVPDEQHEGVCNSEGEIELSGEGTPGSAIININSSITLIPDGGTCSTDTGEPLKGPDGIPCTADDPDQEEPTNLASTTGVAEARVIEANLTANNIEAGAQCGAQPCQTSDEGVPVADCDLLVSDPEAGLIGVTLVNAFGALDAENIGDNVTAARFECVTP